MSQAQPHQKKNLAKSIENISLLGCSPEEASKITGLTKRHLLQLFKKGDYRIVAFKVGREVIFDKAHLQKTKDAFWKNRDKAHS
jgi:hypothetical protein